MPVLKHAKKKQRQDKKRVVENKQVKDLYKKLIKAAKANPSTESLSKAYQSIDKAAKKHIMHKNKAARLKSALAKSTATGAVSKESPKAAGKKAVATKPKTPTKAPTKKATKKGK